MQKTKRNWVLWWS